MQLELGRVDFEQQLLVTETEDRRLRPMEAKLLQYMGDRPGQILSPEELLREVWGYAQGVESRTLYATINRLRLALEKDPKNPVHIITIPRIGYQFQPLKILPEPTQIPRIWNEFIGRDAERGQLGALLAGHRLVTLRGAAGIGKTRLASEFAHHHGQVVWCGLGDQGALEGVVAVLADALGVRVGASGGEALVVASVAGLGDVLVVFDGIDRVHAAVGGLIGRFLGATQARVLVTGQRGVGVGGEVFMTLKPLEGVDAMRLLDVRVREREVGWVFSPKDAWAGPLLGVLGGLPLAIELVAPWLSVMGGEELLVHTRQNLLSLGPLVDRLAWSWPLLTDEDRATLVQCAVFEGAFDLEAARGVVGQGAPVHERLLRLVERSWLMVTARTSGQYFSFYTGQRDFIISQAPESVQIGCRNRHREFHEQLGKTQDFELLYLKGGIPWKRVVARLGDFRRAIAWGGGTGNRTGNGSNPVDSGALIRVSGGGRAGPAGAGARRGKAGADPLRSGGA